jgi:putative tryptophan/tyrosine transport system substrate-binding protein
MRRRAFITLLGGAVTSWPYAARSQQRERVRRIGFLSGAARPVSLESSLYDSFLQGLRELGYVEGRDFVVEWRFAEGRNEIIPALAAELVRSNADVIVLTTSTAVRPTQELTKTIPIIMGISYDPVGNGFIDSLARPGGNTTGLTSSAHDTAPKQLELLGAIVPKLTRVGVLVNPDGPYVTSLMKNLYAAANTAGIDLTRIDADKAQDIDSAFAAVNQRGGQGIVVVSDALFTAQRYRIAELALAGRLPSVFQQREYAEAGGLLSYGQGFREFFRRAAFYVDKIFRGVKPADLPVEQPTKFDLVINLKTAKALGLTVPPTLLTACRRGDRMRRREFIKIISGSAAAWPLAARAAA